MKEFVEAVKRLVDLMPSGAALRYFYAQDEVAKVREMLVELEKPVQSDRAPPTFCHVRQRKFNVYTLTFKGETPIEFHCPHCDEQVGTKAYNKSHELIGR